MTLDGDLYSVSHKVHSRVTPFEPAAANRLAIFGNSFQLDKIMCEMRPQLYLKPDSASVRLR